ncbi:MAG: hypothetical protein WCK33_09235 [Phycisphaerae bacterium]|jgi:hypothetical protein
MENASASWPLRIEGGAFADRAVALAGVLAERGVQAVCLRHGDSAVRHAARGTDLPGVLAAAGPCEVHVESPPEARDIRYRVSADAITLEPG